jgi:hypothetical protein
LNQLPETVFTTTVDELLRTQRITEFSKTTGRKGHKVLLHCKRVMISVSFLRNQLVRTRQPRWMEIHQIDLLGGFD